MKNNAIEESESPENVRLPKWALWSFSGILILCAVFGLAIQRGTMGSHERAAQLGDAFGLLGALFTALAFWAMTVTLWMQREDLKETRREMVQARHVAEKQEKALADQAGTLRQSAAREAAQFHLRKYDDAADNLWRRVANNRVQFGDVEVHFKTARQGDQGLAPPSRAIRGALEHTKLSDESRHLFREERLRLLCLRPARALLTWADAALESLATSDPERGADRFIGLLSDEERLVLAAAGEFHASTYPYLAKHRHRAMIPETLASLIRDARPVPERGYYLLRELIEAR